MKYLVFALFYLIIAIETTLAQDIERLQSKIKWENVILKNYARFKDYKDVDWGSAFIIKYNRGLLACTARDFIGTTYTPGKMLLIKDFDKSLYSWKMYFADDTSQNIVIKSLVLKERIERRWLFLKYSCPFLAFSLENTIPRIVALEPDVRRIRNKDTLFLVGYDDQKKLKMVRGVVETLLNDKYADLEIRIKTSEFVYYKDFVGSPIIDKDGQVVGVFNRAYGLKINKYGRIIDNDEEAENSHYDYFVSGTPMRLMLGKNYGK